MLRHDLMVVGTNAFVAHSLLCNARFPTGVEETEDFDLAWCRGSGVSLTRLTQDSPDKPGSKGTLPRPSLMAVLQGVDASYRLNTRKPDQAVNASGDRQSIRDKSTTDLPINHERKSRRASTTASTTTVSPSIA